MVYAQTYSKCTASQSLFHSCFTETYTKMGGSQKVVSVQRFGQAYATYAFVETDNYLEFQQKMDISL